MHLLLPLLLLQALPPSDGPGVEPSSRFPRGLAVMQLPPPPRGLKGWENVRCVDCHDNVAQAWQAGPHGQSVASVVFQAAIQREQRGWCMRCHAPTATSPSDAPTTAVGCGACHAATSTAPSTHEDHANLAAPWLKDPLLCAQCHQFGFPVRNNGNQVSGLSDATQQQDTYREFLAWQAQTGDARTCQDCHMPNGDHAMGGIRRMDALRRAVTVVWDSTARVLRVHTRDLGHRMPTGDIMRWLSVDVASNATFDDAVTLAPFERVLAVRAFTPGAPPHLGVVESTALPALGQVDVGVPQVLPNGLPPRVWRLTYHLISRKQEEDHMLPAGLSQVTVHAGQLGDPP